MSTMRTLARLAEIRAEVYFEAQDAPGPVTSHVAVSESWCPRNHSHQWPLSATQWSNWSTGHPQPAQHLWTFFHAHKKHNRWVAIELRWFTRQNSTRWKYCESIATCVELGRKTKNTPISTLIWMNKGVCGINYSVDNKETCLSLCWITKICSNTNLIL